MNFKLMLQIVTIAAAVLSWSCSSDCDKKLARVANSNGTRSAQLEVSTCGGATVGYVTYLTLTRSPSNILGDNGNVWATRGWVDAKLKWTTSTRLEVSYPSSALKADDVILKTSRWFDVDIIYIPQTSGEHPPTQP